MHPTSIRLDDELASALDELAAQYGSRTAAIREALRMLSDRDREAEHCRAVGAELKRRARGDDTQARMMLGSIAHYLDNGERTDV